ncbi:MAG: endonuclease, partial [Patescibacteria group bacterium]|nr:endonuclease [Patescibacteria group bacterium]
ERTLADASKDPITDFFRYYLISKKQANIKLPEVYPDFKKQFNRHVGDTQELELVDKFYSDIKRSLKFYELLKLVDISAIRNHPEFKAYEDLSETIFRMRYIRVDLYIPYAMSVLGYHADGQLTDEKLIEVFKLIESYFSRRIMVNFYVTSLDRFMATLHRQILDYLKLDENTDYVEVLKYILLTQTGQTQMPSKDDFETAIRTYPFYEQHSNAIKSYVLSSTHNGSKEAKSTLHSIVEDGLQLTIEHVMPQTITDSWREMLGSDYDRVHSEYLHTLANLTLTGYNSDYSNRPYQDKMKLETKDKKTGEVKKVGFEFSPLAINEWIAKHEIWNEDTLKERQEWWVENLTKVWPLPSTSFEPVVPDTSVDLLDDIQLRGKSVKSVEAFGEKTSVSSWAEALDVITESLYDRNQNFLDVIKEDEYLSKNVRQDSSAFRNSVEILDTGYHVDTGTNTDSKLRLIRALAEAFNLTQGDIRAELNASIDSETEIDE